MKTTIPCISNLENKIKYFYDVNQNIFGLLHPLVLFYCLVDEGANVNNFELHSFSNFDKKYYKKKYEYLRANGFFTKIVYPNKISYINADTVLDSIKNLGQIVFEVTDKCNLKCKYCAYGDMYQDYDERAGNTMPFDLIKNVLNYLKSNILNSNDLFYISFYGGEPLLCMDLINKTVSYVKNLNLSKNIIFTMTTNGLLLDRYIEFLKENKFKILVSIDGNKINNSYRIFHSGRSSFEQLFKILKMLKNKHNKYFEDNFEFNTVLHNRNSITEAHEFLYKEFGKITTIAELDNSGIHPEMFEQFHNMFHDSTKELKLVKNKKKLINQQLAKNPIAYNLAIFLKTRTKNTFDFYENILTSDKFVYRIPSGTCLPFQKKMFITLNGKILPCERISHEYALGSIDKEKVNLDFAGIALKYNFYYSKIRTQCVNCYHYEDCIQCLFQIDNFCQSFQCTKFSNAQRFSNYLGEVITTIEDTPHLIKKIINKIVIK